MLHSQAGAKAVLAPRLPESVWELHDYRTLEAGTTLVDRLTSMAPANGRIRAVLLDLDGTLYHQRRLRLWMAFELAMLPLRGLSRARRVLREIGCFRRVREELRDRGRPEESLDELQYSEAARRIGADTDAVRATVTEWMMRRPLKYMRRCRRADMPDFFDFLKGHGVEAGIFSDYPAEDQLTALGVREYMSVCVSAVDREVNAFKPHPAGLLHACTLWGLEPHEVLYVGDRADVDGAGAEAAGMPFVLISRRPVADHLWCTSFLDLKRMIAELGVEATSDQRT